MSSGRSFPDSDDRQYESFVDAIEHSGLLCYDRETAFNAARIVGAVIICAAHILADALKAKEVSS